MRKEPFTVGSYVHVIKRGARGLSVVRDDDDRWRFMLMLKHFNDEYPPQDWFRGLMLENKSHTFLRPSIWPKQKKIVEILAYCLLDNHFHLLLREIKDGGISEFMKKIGVGMSLHFNEKYGERGSLFQGAYKARTIDSDQYLNYVAMYIMVKNAFDMRRGGAEKAAKEFEKAYEWAVEYPYTSLGEYVGNRNSGILDRGILAEKFCDEKELKIFARDFVAGKYADVFYELDSSFD